MPDVLLRLDVTAGSIAQGHTVADALGSAAGVQILGIRTVAGVFTVGEPTDPLLREGDAVLVLTTHDGIDELEEHWSRII